MLKYLLFGIYFGILITKGEVISWYRIQEMFRFQSIHMYGVIGSAVFVGAIGILMLKKFKAKALNGETIEYPIKPFNHGYWMGGIIFGVGWALTGSCPGPMYALAGAGYWGAFVMIFFAIFGTWVYSYFREKLPHG